MCVRQKLYVILYDCVYNMAIGSVTAPMCVLDLQFPALFSSLFSNHRGSLKCSFSATYYLLLLCTFFTPPFLVCVVCHVWQFCLVAFSSPPIYAIYCLTMFWNWSIMWQYTCQCPRHASPGSTWEELIAFVLRLVSTQEEFPLTCDVRGSCTKVGHFGGQCNRSQSLQIQM